MLWLGPIRLPAAAPRTLLTQHSRDTPQFYLTAPSPCPYLAGKEERKVFTHLVGERAPELNNILTQGGFRRSQSIAYRPAFEGCRSCVSVRVVAKDFRPSQSMRRIARRNADIVSDMRIAVPTSEQYAIFRAYLDSRHRDGGMADMTVLGDGLSMVYSFFEPDLSARSLGTLMVLDHISRAQRMGLSYVYLGYWVRGSRKMDYKGRFLPQERLMPEGWARVE